MTAYKMVAPVDLSSKRAEASIRRAVKVAKALDADLTLLSVVERRRLERGDRDPWPEIAFDCVSEVPAVHRVVVPGPPEDAIPRYADQIAADVVVLGKEHLLRRWFKKSSVASSVAAVTTRALLIVPDDDTLVLDRACVASVGKGQEHPAHQAARAIASRCGGELRSWPAPYAMYQLVDAAMLERVNLMVTTNCGGDMLSIASRLPCALLLLKPAAAHPQSAQLHGASPISQYETSAR